MHSGSLPGLAWNRHTACLFKPGPPDIRTNRQGGEPGIVEMVV